jgi:transposase
MKFSQTLSQPEIITLEQLYHNGFNHRLRQRAHIILMSNNKFSIDEIAKTMSLDRDTISVVIDSWESVGLIGLYDFHRSGRPPIFTQDEEEKIIKNIDSDPRSLRNTTSEINKDTGKNASTHTVKRVLKKHNKIWKRMKKTLAGKPEEEAVEKAEKDIDELKKKNLKEK